VTTLVTTLGPFRVFLLMVPESACIPIPSEATLLASGLAVERGWMSPLAAIAAATAGNLVGSLIAYAVGRSAASQSRGGRRHRALARCNRLFGRHGARAVFLARLMPIARTFVSLPAGYARVPLGPFIAMTTIGCAIWAGAFTYLGLAAGGASAELSGWVGTVALGVSATILLALLCRLGRER
jgi:membrane protein DedA with SNARE-associated domain